MVDRQSHAWLPSFPGLCNSTAAFQNLAPPLLIEWGRVISPAVLSFPAKVSYPLGMLLKRFSGTTALDQTQSWTSLPANELRRRAAVAASAREKHFLSGIERWKADLR